MNISLSYFRIPVKYTCEVHDFNTLLMNAEKPYHYKFSGYLENKPNTHLIYDVLLPACINDDVDDYPLCKHGFSYWPKYKKEPFLKKFIKEKNIYNFNEILDVILFHFHIPIELREYIFQYFHLDYQDWFIKTMMLQAIGTIWNQNPTLQSKKVFLFQMEIECNWRQCTDDPIITYSIFGGEKYPTIKRVWKKEMEYWFSNAFKN
jgi:hypothetical protein